MVHVLTSEFLVNDKTEFAQHDSAIAPLAGGGFAIGWIDVQSVPETGPFGDVLLPISDQVRGRAFDAAGQAVAPSLVLSGEVVPHDTYFSALDGIALMNGDVAFGWRTQYTDVYEEQTRAFSPALVATSDVNRPEFGGSQAPRLGLDLAATTGADYLLAYLHDGAGTIAAISGKSRIISDTHTQDDAKALSLVGLGDGKAALVYFGPLEFGAGPTLNVQTLDATGAALALPHAIPVEPASVDAIDTALLSNGTIVVLLGFTGEVAAKALIVDPEGNVVVPTFAAGDHDGKVAALSDGGFAVAWTDRNPATGDGSGSAVRTQVFSDNGAAAGAAVLVNGATSGDQFDPDVTSLANGDFVVSWTDASGESGDTSGTGIKARVLALDGPPVNGMVKDGDEGNDILRGTPATTSCVGTPARTGCSAGRATTGWRAVTGNDTIFGGKGDDTALAGAGHDRIWTGKGSDLVVFKEGDGKDRVFDFDQRRGGNDHSFDRVQLDVSIGTNAIDDFDGA